MSMLSYSYFGGVVVFCGVGVLREMRSRNTGSQQKWLTRG